MEKILNLPWQVPLGELSFRVDPLSLIFLLSVLILSVCAGVYGWGYMRQYQGRKNLGLHLFFYIVFILAMLLIVTANSVILFLSSWEMMTISTYFLIVFNEEKQYVRKAGFIYLIASHCATFFLFLMFFLMAHTSGSMNFLAMSRMAFSPLVAGIIFSLSLLGFGVKAGFIPLHIWLPYAHPVAPSHISALLSGIAIKMGIYGICRVLWIVGVVPEWCGYAFLLIGICSGLMGVLYALGQHEIKRLLAYHSIENIGIIAIGLGVGLLGKSYNVHLLTVLGFGGALLHVVNHSIFKGLLFLGAGSVINKTRSGELDHLGGLAQSMPVTSALFLVGALSICGLPLFNGFISEFIIYLGLLKGVFSLPLSGVMLCVVGILSLALMGALALACFCKVYGVVFLGKPRSAALVYDKVPTTVEHTSQLMLVPMLVLAAICIWIGLAPQTMVRAAFAGAACLSSVELVHTDLQAAFVPLARMIGTVFLFMVLLLVFILLRYLLRRRQPSLLVETWSCGFADVSTRSQYTASSFADNIVRFAGHFLLTRRQNGQVKGMFPAKVGLSSSVTDVAEHNLFRPLLAAMNEWSRKINDGRVFYTQVYLMYIFFFLIFLLVWKLR